MQSLPLAAFVAGLVSFLSPCVLPLVPGYVSLISGAGVEELKRRDSRVMRAVMLNAILFVLGFSAVFLALGAAATTVGQLVRQHIGWLSKVAGAVVVVLGLHQTGALPIRALYADKRFHGIPTGTTGARISGRLRFRTWVDTMCRPNPGGYPDVRCHGINRIEGRRTPGCLCTWSCASVSGDRGQHRRLPPLLCTISPTSA